VQFFENVSLPGGGAQRPSRETSSVSAPARTPGTWSTLVGNDERGPRPIGPSRPGPAIHLRHKEAKRVRHLLTNCAPSEKTYRGARPACMPAVAGCWALPLRSTAKRGRQGRVGEAGQGPAGPLRARGSTSAPATIELGQPPSGWPHVRLSPFACPVSRAGLGGRVQPSFPPIRRQRNRRSPGA